MKKSTIKKVNSLVLKYMVAIGVTDDERLTNDNPINIYFIENLMDHYLNEMNNNASSLFLDGREMSLFDTDKFELECPTEDVILNRSQFHNLIKESYRIYRKLSDTSFKNKILNTQVREMFSDFIKDDKEYITYVNQIISKYNESLFDLLFHCNTKNNDLINIKIDIIEDQIQECVRCEDYLKAHQLKADVDALYELLNI